MVFFLDYPICPPFVYKFIPNIPFTDTLVYSSYTMLAFKTPKFDFRTYELKRMQKRKNKNVFIIIEGILYLLIISLIIALIWLI